MSPGKRPFIIPLFCSFIFDYCRLIRGRGSFQPYLKLRSAATRLVGRRRRAAVVRAGQQKHRHRRAGWGRRVGRAWVRKVRPLAFHCPSTAFSWHFTAFPPPFLDLPLLFLDLLLPFQCNSLAFHCLFAACRFEQGREHRCDLDRLRSGNTGSGGGAAARARGAGTTLPFLDRSLPFQLPFLDRSLPLRCSRTPRPSARR